MYQVLLFKSRRHLCKGSMSSLSISYKSDHSFLVEWFSIDLLSVGDLDRTIQMQLTN